MRMLLSGGLMVFAGVVSPMAISPQQAPRAPQADYRTDPRAEILRRFFDRADCPAAQYTYAFLEAADQYALDWRLLPSISFVESTGGKAAPNHNLFGWQSGRAQFSSAAAAIQAVGYRLSHSALYRDKSLDTVLATYNPVADYAQKVKSVMRRIAPNQ